VRAFGPAATSRSGSSSRELAARARQPRPGARGPSCRAGRPREGRPCCALQGSSSAARARRSSPSSARRRAPVPPASWRGHLAPRAPPRPARQAPSLGGGEAGMGMRAREPEWRVAR
ncbi:unnamed protein product, partial [Prorocentrum cordatum]